MKKLLCALLTIVLALGCFAALAEEDLQAQLDAANARIAELEALIAPKLAASYKGGVIWLEDAQTQYDSLAAQYRQFGFDPDAMGMAAGLKQDITEGLVQNAILSAKATEMGLDQFTEEELAAMTEEAQAELNYYVEYYLPQFFPDTEEYTDDMRKQTEQVLAQNGIGIDVMLESSKNSEAMNKLRAKITEGVAVDDAEIEEAYKALIEQNKESYQSDRTFNSDRSSGVAIAWNPEGYRAVKQVLIKFTDDQASRYSDLADQVASLEEEKAAAEAPAGEAAEEEAAEEAPAEETAKRSVELIDADIAACKAELEALYKELEPKCNEVIEAYKNGTPIEELIENYNEDPGMQSGITAEIGYAVREGSDNWDPAFTAAAMSIDEVGGLSEPAYGSYGAYIVYYFSDIPAGEVALEEIRDAIAEDALETKTNKVYDDQVTAWVEEAGVEYFLDNFA